MDWFLYDLDLRYELTNNACVPDLRLRRWLCDYERTLTASYLTEKFNLSLIRVKVHFVSLQA